MPKAVRSTISIVGLSLLVAGDPVGWYIGEYGYDQLHAHGIDGAGLTIAIAEHASDPITSADRNRKWALLTSGGVWATRRFVS
ncbi:hypothetical protein EG850_13025 [Gulosibacter macacae]|uniref:Uncharacterized protein n=1 Tax=Gulosibacter macacae TaxID=2488791 RepID=A0A3P3VTB4_9MICO|nr:hypothetical protein [Gulosibacter macacae]RRJ85557.1 hypothetical protein EG850_13025 [Gulosibacter macacae]